ncbi:MAG: hypothetical protein V7754_14930 [Halioglobus sp.]
MKTLSTILLTALSVVLILGCELKEEEPKGVIPEGHLNAMKKAENVEGLLQDANKKQLEEIDAASH